MSVYRKTRSAIFWGVLILLTVVTSVTLDRMGLFWNLWAQLLTMLATVVVALALSRAIPRWLNVEDDR